MCVCCVVYPTWDFRLVFRLKKPIVESRKMTVESLTKCCVSVPYVNRAQRATERRRSREWRGLMQTQNWEALGIPSLLDPTQQLQSLRLGSLLLISPLSGLPEHQLGRKGPHVFHLVLWNVLTLWRCPESWCPAGNYSGFLNSVSDKAK